MADSSCTRDERRERIVAECNAVRQALQELLDTYTAGVTGSQVDQSLENMLRSRPVGGNVKSPQTPGGQLQPQRSPGPGSGYVVARHGTSFPHPIPTLTSYPPPPISPMSQFNSPPPPVPKLMPPPASNHPPAALQRSDSSNTQLRSDDLNNLRVPLKRPKVN